MPSYLRIGFIGYVILQMIKIRCGLGFFTLYLLTSQIMQKRHDPWCSRCDMHNGTRKDFDAENNPLETPSFVYSVKQNGFGNKYLSSIML